MRIIKEMYAQTSTNSYIPCEVNRCVVSELFFVLSFMFSEYHCRRRGRTAHSSPPSTRVTHVGTAGEQRKPKASVSVRPTPPPLRRMGGGEGEASRSVRTVWNFV